MYNQSLTGFSQNATSIDEIKKYANGVVVELPGFIDGIPFYAKIKRPSLLSLAANGKIPNTLMHQATEMFAKGAGAMVGTNSVKVRDVYDVVTIVCESAFVEPTWEELKNNEITLTDEQLMAVFSYTQGGIKELEKFFPERANS